MCYMFDHSKVHDTCTYFLHLKYASTFRVRVAVLVTSSRCFLNETRHQLDLEHAMNLTS